MKKLKQDSYVNNSILWTLMVLVAIFCACTDEEGQTALEQELATIRQATEAFDTMDEATTMGYTTDVSGYVSGMGHHFLNPSLVDDNFEVDKPEIVLYAPDENGDMQFVAVEYIVPITDINNPPPAPDGFTGEEDVWAINAAGDLWTLHCWIELENEMGVFASVNPKIP